MTQSATPSRRRPPPNEHQLSFVVYDDPAPVPEYDRPQARVLRDGVSACSTLELLQVVIGGRDPERAARQLLDQFRDLRGIATRSVYELSASTYGLGESKAALVKACLELGKRLWLGTGETRPQIKTPADAAQLLMAEMGLLEQEEVRTMLLDTRNRVISTPMLYRGSLNAAGLRVGEVFREAIRQNCAAVIIAHNHPSQDPAPSAEDIRVTRDLVQAGKLLSIDVVDHIVIAADSYVSLRERGLGFA